MAGTDRIRRGAWLVALLIVALTVGTPRLARVAAGPANGSDADWMESAESFEALQSCTGGTYSETLTDAATHAPVPGANVTVVETGFTTTSGPDGKFSVNIPGPGKWTIRVTNPPYPVLEIRIEISSDCRLVDVTHTEIPDTSSPTPPPQPPTPTPRPFATPRPSASPQPSTTPGPGPAATPSPDSHRFSGTLMIEGRPAPTGTEVRGLVGDTLCGRNKVATEGRYTLNVDAASVHDGCGRNVTAVQLAVWPEFGTGWRISATSPFQGGGATTRNIS